MFMILVWNSGPTLILRTTVSLDEKTNIEVCTEQTFFSKFFQSKKILCILKC